MKKILITGMPGSGKSTLISTFFSSLNNTFIKGIITEKEKDEIYLYKYINHIIPESRLLVGNCKKNEPLPVPHIFDSSGVKYINEIIAGTDLYFIDEIGIIENSQKKYVKKIVETWEISIDSIFVIKKNSSNLTAEMLSESKQPHLLIDLDIMNRETAAEKLQEYYFGN